MSAPAGCRPIGRSSIVEADACARRDLDLGSHVALKRKRHPSSTAC
jgi:hypothetical protein